MTPPAIRIQDVYYRYSRRAPYVLEGITLDVAPGSIMGLVGESGSGKSTLGRLIVDERQQTSGLIEIEGKTWNRTTRKGDLRKSVQMIFQDPYSALNPYLTPLEAVTEATKVAQRLTTDAARDKASELLQQVGLHGELVDRTPASLSGGQRQRVVIARALACEPRILIADEATSALDVSVQAQILNLLMKLQSELGLTMLFVSHDMAVIRHVTDEVAVLQHGKIVEHGTTEKIMKQPEHPYTARLLSAYDDEPRRVTT